MECENTLILNTEGEDFESNLEEKKAVVAEVSKQVGPHKR